MKTSLLVKATKKWWKNHPILIFIGLFSFQIVLFYIIYLNPWMQDHFFALWANLNAGISGKFLQLIGYQTTVMSDIITSPQFTVSIKKGCDAMEPLALFFSGIIAFPTLWKKKLSGLGVGLLIIFTLNIIRIVTLFLTGIYYPSLFETMHVEVWQVIFILTAIAIWFLWLRWAVKQTKK